jgi:hypothetical protein
MGIRNVVAVLSFGFLGLASMGSNCFSRPVPQGEGEGEDEPGPKLCQFNEDCADPARPEAVWDCVGTCQQRCLGEDSLCNLNEYCAGSYCAVGCRDSSVCEAGELCRAGACVAGGQSECSSKCDCATGQVCDNGACADPPARCSSGADCPRGPGDQCEAYLCNSVNDTCIDPSPDPCNNDGECVGRPGCFGATPCVCTPNQDCVPNVGCTAQTEEVCGLGFYCNNDLSCAPLPPCVSAGDVACTSVGLVCSPGAGRCERPEPCASSADCASASGRTHCSSGFCAVPTCTNGGRTCNAATEECAVNGNCVPAGTGAACQGDGQCPPDQYCNLELAASECAIGCRNGASCAQGQDCNGAHQCVNSGGGSTGQYGDPCADSSECGSGLICGSSTDTCAEQCADAAECIACSAQSGSPCRCNFFGFCVP